MEGEAPRRGPGRRRNLAKTRAALIDAATEVFARKGYSESSLDEVAEAAGFTRGAVHHHFSSKWELFLAVIARRDEELLAGYASEFAAGSPLDSQASAAKWQQLHQDRAIDVALRLELRSQALRNEAVRLQYAAVEHAAIQATAAQLEKSAADSGLVWRHPVEVVAELLHAASHAAAERAALTGDSSEALMAAFTGLVWYGAFNTPTEEG